MKFLEHRAVVVTAWIFCSITLMIVISAGLTPHDWQGGWTQAQPKVYSGPLQCWPAGHRMLDCIDPEAQRGVYGP